jgi:hypothetical protein
MSLQRLERQSLSVTRLRFRLRGSRRPEPIPGDLFVAPHPGSFSSHQT